MKGALFLALHNEFPQQGVLTPAKRLMEFGYMATLEPEILEIIIIQVHDRRSTIVTRESEECHMIESFDKQAWKDIAFSLLKGSPNENTRVRI